MKSAQYIRQERAIAAADAGAIRERWIWGLRLLRDPEAFSRGSSQLKPHYAEALVQAAAKAGFRLSIREINYRMQMAKAYATESQIAQACESFANISALREAGFPAYEPMPGEPPADHRTEAERLHDRARALMDLVGEGGALFPARRFDPSEATLQELKEYTDEQEALSARFVERGRKRRAYLDALVESAGGDLSTLWQKAALGDLDFEELAAVAA